MGSVLGTLCSSVLGRPAQSPAGDVDGGPPWDSAADAPGRRSSVERLRQAPWADACSAGHGFSPRTLLELSVRAVCEGLAEGRGPRGARDMGARLPPDLVQRVFDALAAEARMDLPLIAAASDWGLQRVALPGNVGACDAWVAAGVIPHCATLLSLDLGRADIGDASAALLGANLRALRELRLDHCVRLSDAGLAEVGRGLVGLRTLSLVGCTALTGRGVAHLAALSELRVLDLSRCYSVRGGLEALEGLGALEDLDLGSCFELGDAAVAPLAALAALRTLCLAHTKVTDDGICAALPAPRPCMAALDVSGCESLSDAALVHVAAACPALASLGASHCPLLGAPRGARALAARCRLRSLNLAYTMVTDASLVALVGREGAGAALETLTLEACEVGDVGAAAVAHAYGATLRALDLSDTQVTDVGAGEVARNCPGLRQLALSFTRVGDPGVAAVSLGCPALEDLGIDTARVTDDALGHLHRLGALRTLDLFGARVTDAGAAQLGRCLGLVSLDVCGGALTDAGVLALARLPRLEQLNLAHNRAITDASVDALARMPSLVRLNLSRTRVSCDKLTREFLNATRPAAHQHAGDAHANGHHEDPTTLLELFKAHAEVAA